MAPTRRGRGEHPLVSVVIPVRNEAQRVGACLTALSRTTYPKDRLEILVIDAESGDKTREIANQFQADGLPIRVLSNPRRTRGAGLNRGIGAAKGQIIMCLDARNECPSEYIYMCVETLFESGADNAGGVIQSISETPTQEAIGLAMSHPFGVGYAPFRLGNRTGDVASVYLGCFRRSVFERVGLFDERADISEDSDMNLRIRESGGRVYLDSKIKMPYHGRDRLRDLWRLYSRYGIQRAGTLVKHGKPTAPRQLIPPTLLLVLALLPFLSLWHLWFLWSLPSAFGAYVVIDLLVSAKLSFTRKNIHLFPRLCMAFPCMHFAYALGLLRRMVWRPRSEGFLKA